MNALIIVYMVISSIFALLTLTYVAVDIILEVRDKDEPIVEPPVEEPVVVAVEEPVEEPPVEEIPVLEQVDASEADQLISDELAMKNARYESGAGHGKQGIINIDTIDENFDENEVVTLAALKAKGLVPKSIGRIKILARGIMDKPLTIKAESYSVQAIKMIELTGGTVIILRD